MTNANHWPISREEFLRIPNHEDFSNSVSLKMSGKDEGRFNIREKLPNQESQFRIGQLFVQNCWCSNLEPPRGLRDYSYWPYKDIQIFHQLWLKMNLKTWKLVTCISLKTGKYQEKFHQSARFEFIIFKRPFDEFSISWRFEWYSTSAIHRYNEIEQSVTWYKSAARNESRWNGKVYATVGRAWIILQAFWWRNVTWESVWNYFDIQFLGRTI